MAHESENPKKRAQELYIQARREPLAPEEERFMREFMAAHADVRAEAEADAMFLEAFKEARIAPSPSYGDSLRRRLVACVSEEYLEGRARSGAGLLARLSDLLFGAPAWVPARRLVLARSVAMVLGILVGVLIYTSHASSHGDARPSTRFTDSEAARIVEDAIGTRNRSR